MTKMIVFYDLTFKYTSLQFTALCYVFLIMYHGNFCVREVRMIFVYVCIIIFLFLQPNRRRTSDAEVLNSPCNKMNK